MWVEHEYRWGSSDRTDLTDPRLDVVRSSCAAVSSTEELWAELLDSLHQADLQQEFTAVVKFRKMVLHAASAWRNQIVFMYL